MRLASSSLGNHHFSLTHRPCLPCSEPDADSVNVQSLISPMARCDRPGSNGSVCINDAALKLIPWESSLHAHAPSMFAVLRLSSVETLLLNQRDLISVLNFKALAFQLARTVSTRNARAFPWFWRFAEGLAN